MTVWVGRVVDDNDKEAEALRNGVCIAGWDKISDFLKFKDEADLRHAITSKYPAKNNMGVAGWIGQILRFRDEISIGDIVVMPSKLSPVFHIGVVTGDYEYAATPGGKFRHRHPVKWVGEIKKSDIHKGASGSIGAFLSVFKVNKPAFEQQLRDIISANSVSGEVRSGEQSS